MSKQPSKLFQLPVIVTAVRTSADKGLELKLHTRDVKTFKPVDLASLMAMLDKEYWTVFAEVPISPEQVVVGDERVERGQKTASMRLRGVIYRIWEQSNREQDSETYYQVKMESLINSLKEKIQ